MNSIILPSLTNLCISKLSGKAKTWIFNNFPELQEKIALCDIKKKDRLNRLLNDLFEDKFYCGSYYDVLDEKVVRYPGIQPSQVKGSTLCYEDPSDNLKINIVTF